MRDLPTFEGGRERWVSEDGNLWITEYPDGRVEVITIDLINRKVPYVTLDDLTKRALLTILSELEEAQQAMRREA